MDWGRWLSEASVRKERMPPLPQPASLEALAMYQYSVSGRRPLRAALMPAPAVTVYFSALLFFS